MPDPKWGSLGMGWGSRLERLLYAVNRAWDGYWLVARACRECGCTEREKCMEQAGGPCYWVEPDWCSVCAGQ